LHNKIHIFDVFSNAMRTLCRGSRSGQNIAEIERITRVGLFNYKIARTLSNPGQSRETGGIWAYAT